MSLGSQWHACWQLGMGIACKVMGQELGRKGRQEAGRKGSRSPRRASPLGLLNNGREGGRELGSAGGTTGHAPVTCSLLLPEPGRLPPAGTRLPAAVLSLVPQLPAPRLPAILCPGPSPPLPSEAAAWPFPPKAFVSLLWREMNLRLRFPKWKSNFFPCKLPLFCFVS